ncbi:hypothetical protein [Streptomyces sp. NPDC005209]|uniref:hypothetical protein n=1 Tax=Streptomyces sp. NPDC005209 TaxID=3156715 RepID=UPI0033BEF96B
MAAMTEGGQGRPAHVEPARSARAAGDVRSGSVKRVASALGEDAMAIRLVHEHRESAVIDSRVNIASRSGPT